MLNVSTYLRSPAFVMARFLERVSIYCRYRTKNIAYNCILSSLILCAGPCQVLRWALRVIEKGLSAFAELVWRFLGTGKVSLWMILGATIKNECARHYTFRNHYCSERWIVKIAFEVAEWVDTRTAASDPDFDPWLASSSAGPDASASAMTHSTLNDI